MTSPFISQPDADAELLEALGQFLLEDSQVDRMTSIAIRLHPAYVASAGAIPEGFRLPGVRVVNPQDESIYATLAKSKAVVGAYSTALFEALYFDKAVYTIANDTNLIARSMTESGGWMSWTDRGTTRAGAKEGGLNFMQPMIVITAFSSGIGL